MPHLREQHPALPPHGRGGPASEVAQEVAHRRQLLRPQYRLACLQTGGGGGRGRVLHPDLAVARAAVGFGWAIQLRRGAFAVAVAVAAARYDGPVWLQQLLVRSCQVTLYVHHWSHAEAVDGRYCSISAARTVRAHV